MFLHGITLACILLACDTRCLDAGQRLAAYELAQLIALEFACVNDDSKAKLCNSAMVGK